MCNLSVSQIRSTQRAIKHVLRERWYAWDEARELYNSGYRPEEHKGMVGRREKQKARALEQRNVEDEKQNRQNSEDNAENTGSENKE